MVGENLKKVGEKLIEKNRSCRDMWQEGAFCIYENSGDHKCIETAAPRENNIETKSKFSFHKFFISSKKFSNSPPPHTHLCPRQPHGALGGPHSLLNHLLGRLVEADLELAQDLGPEGFGVIEGKLLEQLPILRCYY